jgi:hypothetical protein
MSELEIKWSIEAPVDNLMDSASAAGINLNAINPGIVDADLIYPSFFCTSKPAWIKALAYLFVRRIHFRLFLFGTNALGDEQWRYRMYPEMDSEMLALMGEIDAAEARQLEHLQDKMGVVADRLRTMVREEDFLTYS